MLAGAGAMPVQRAPGDQGIIRGTCACRLCLAACGYLTSRRIQVPPVARRHSMLLAASASASVNLTKMHLTAPSLRVSISNVALFFISVRCWLRGMLTYCVQFQFSGRSRLPTCPYLLLFRVVDTGFSLKPLKGSMMVCAAREK